MLADCNVAPYIAFCAASLAMHHRDDRAAWDIRGVTVQ
jgi:hypothetical protein